MKILKSLSLPIALIIFLFVNNNVYAQWQSDSKYGFKINIPPSWSKTSYKDGTDKVYDFYSPDENAAIQLRAFKATAGVTIDLLVQIYEQNMLPAGAQRQSLNNHTSHNGIPGKQGTYLMNYNGNQVALAVFYTIQNGNGFVLTAIVPVSMVDQKGAEVKAITQSFMLDGFAQKAQTSTTKIGGIVGMTGGRNSLQSNGSSANVKVASGRYNFISRSDGKVLMNYHYLFIESDGNFYEEYQLSNSGNYVGKTRGMWSVKGNQLIVKHNNSSVVDTYTIRGKELIRKTDNGIVFTFRKQ